MTKNNKKNSPQFYTINDVIENSFYKLPKALFENQKYSDLSIESKVIYAFLQDRMNLSQENGWINEEGEVYLIFTRAQMASLLKCTEKTIRKAINQLIKHELVWEKRQGLGRPNLIFIKRISMQKKELQDREKIPVRAVKNTGQERENLPGIKTDINKTDIIKTEILYTGAQKTKKSKSKKFIPPELSEVIQFFLDNNYSKEQAVNAFNYYVDGNWTDARGKPVINWKQKMRANWFKEDKKTKRQEHDTILRCPTEYVSEDTLF